MLLGMRSVQLLGLCLILTAGPAFAGTAAEDEGPLGPCVKGDSTTSDAQTASGPAWGVELATSFNKQEALDDFASVQKQYSDLLGSDQPLIVEDCDLHMGMAPQYSARIGVDSRDDADALCTKLKAQGGACLVKKN